MNDKGFYSRGHSPLTRIKDSSWLTGHPSTEFDLPLSCEAQAPHSRLLSILKRVGWLTLAASIMAGLVAWGFHSRFGLLLLLLLR
ncbi:hypothetical protein C5U62_27150 [Pseudomonas protegens]|uniref:Uncharacterized protein n=1 Tax=Pseudomonas protegens TaxID=380021 RepID=A0A2T6GDB9_9PSED|nr:MULTISPECIES: hypothetical protein [Pseudomonas]PUA42149.1 hypothetical protein C5U62_27150 [Pseudomonas protegens]RXU63534.1 hypothetical protein CW358_20145 [Pseudomonas protegens]ULT72603.1 hypothetical protein L1O02_09665 [Pseudomonas sp. BC42]